MRLVRIIPISNISPPTSLSWTQNLIKYVENLSGNEIIFDDYTIDTQLIYLSKNRAEKVSELNISILDQKLPKISELLIIMLLILQKKCSCPYWF